MLTQAQIQEYQEVGAIVVPNVLTPEEVRTLSGVTDGFVERARGLTTHTPIYDLEDSHTPDHPRVRRIKAAHLHDPAYAALARHPRILSVLQALWGPDIRFDTAKLNMEMRRVRGTGGMASGLGILSAHQRQSRGRGRDV
jgi:phytanoyl-CoA hydroxylase